MCCVCVCECVCVCVVESICVPSIVLRFEACASVLCVCVCR